VHALFAGDALALLQAVGPARVITCNTVLHPTNAIDLDRSLAQAVREVGHKHGVKHFTGRHRSDRDSDLDALRLSVRR